MIKCDLVVGIDPGKSGSICYYNEGLVKAIHMPMEAKDMQEYIKYLKTICKFPVVFIEKLQYRPSDRNIPGKDFQIAKMLKHHERLCTTLDLNGVLYFQVPPVTWQTYLNLKIKKKEEKDERKRRYRDVAQSLYPQLKVTLWSGDAILLMHFGRKKLQFDQGWLNEHLPESYKKNTGLSL